MTSCLLLICLVDENHCVVVLSSATAAVLMVVTVVSWPHVMVVTAKGMMKVPLHGSDVVNKNNFLCALIKVLVMDYVYLALGRSS